MGSMSEALRNNAAGFLAAAIINISTEEDSLNMNMTELKSKTSAELRDIYNKLVEKQVKRFKSREEAEKRVVEALKSADQWEGAKSAKADKADKAPNAPKATKGAPRKNVTYKIKETDAKMHEGSARTKVYNFVKAAAKNGRTREQIEDNFAEDETVNVQSAISYLVKFDLLEVVAQAE